MAIHESTYAFADEFFEVGKVVEVRMQIDGQSQTIRIEALFHPASAKHYARAYIQDCFKVQPSYPQSRGRFDREPLDCTLWLDHPVPWLGSDDADAAITLALKALRETAE